MNNTNIKRWKKDDLFHAEWADRALDDEDRYAEDSIIITASGTTEKELNANLYNAYDRWVKETRYGD